MMSKNEFTLKLAEMILSDWRKVMLANATCADRFNLPGDVCDISLRALQKAAEMADDFYRDHEVK